MQDLTIKQKQLYHSQDGNYWVEMVDLGIKEKSEIPNLITTESSVFKKINEKKGCFFYKNQYDEKLTVYEE